VQTTDNEHMNIIAEKYIPLVPVLYLHYHDLRHEKYIPAQRI